MKPKKALVIYTIGHSTRTIDGFTGMLQAHNIQFVVDVRTIPRSRMNPQFNMDSLRESLNSQGIGYLHMEGLGGLRHAKKGSVNTGWHNASFRGFADYMQTEEFSENLDRLVEIARKKRTVIMCAEGAPFRCHRSLIADALLARGVGVEHITSKSAARAHEMTPFAHVEGKRITYPEEETSSKAR